MKTVLLGQRPPEVEAFLARRRVLGQDLFDEVWEGTYHARRPLIRGTPRSELLHLSVADLARGSEWPR